MNAPGSFRLPALMCKFMEIGIDERRDVLPDVLLVVGPQLIVVSTLLLHVGQRCFKSLQPSVQISPTRPSYLTGDTSFPSTRFEVFHSQRWSLTFPTLPLQVLLYVMSERGLQLYPDLQA